VSDPHSTDQGSDARVESTGTWHAPLPKAAPAPTYAPAALALGLLLAAWGVMTHWIMTATGAALTGWALAEWFAGLRSDWRRGQESSR